MKTYIVRYWTGGATIRFVAYKAKDEEGAVAKFYRYRCGEVWVLKKPNGAKAPLGLREVI